MKWLRQVTSDIFSRLSIKLSMGFNIQCNKLLNVNKSIPQSVFTQNTKMGRVWLLKTISISFSVELVYILVQLKVLIVGFVENKQQDDSFHLFTIIITDKTKTLFIVFSIECIFLPQGDKILKYNSINTHIDCFKTVSPLQVNSNLTRSLASELCTIFC